jgi:hypothetical protein
MNVFLLITGYLLLMVVVFKLVVGSYPDDLD